MTGGQLVFEVPANPQSLTLRADFPNARLPSGEVIRPDPIMIPLQGTTPTDQPSTTPLWQVEDDTLIVSILAQQTVSEFAGIPASEGKAFVVLDLDITNRGEKPEFFQTQAQLNLVDTDGNSNQPHPVSDRGIYRPYKNVWVPNGEHRRFQLVYETDPAVSPVRFSYNGFTLAQVFALTEEGATTLTTETAANGFNSSDVEATNTVRGSGIVNEREVTNPAQTANTATPKTPAAAPKPRIQLAAYQKFEPQPHLEQTLQQISEASQRLKALPFLPIEIPDYAAFEQRFGPSTEVEPEEETPTQLTLGQPVTFAFTREQDALFSLEVSESLAKQGRIHIYLANSTDSLEDKSVLDFTLRDPDERYEPIERRGVSFAVTDIQLPVGEHKLELSCSTDEEMTVRMIAVAESGVSDRESEDNHEEISQQSLIANHTLFGRLLPSDDEDVFHWKVTEKDSQRKWTLAIAANPTGESLRAVFRTRDEKQLKNAHIPADSTNNWVDLSPPPGDYLLKLRSNNIHKPCGYQLILKDVGPSSDNFEAEPNDSCIPEMLKVFEPGSAEQATYYGQFVENEKDYFILNITEPDRIYTISLQGDGVNQLVYVDSEGHTMRRCGATKTLQPTLVDLSLPLGRNLFYVEGKSSDYVVGLQSMPTPPSSFEKEPNDERRQAQKIKMGTDYMGRLVDTYDDDIYRFTVHQAMDYQVIMEIPEGALMRYRLDSDSTYIQSEDIQQSTTLERIRLYPENHFLQLSTSKPFLSPYSVRVEPLNPFGEGDGTLSIHSDSKSITAAAYLDQYQQLEIPLTVENSSDSPITFSIATQTSHFQVHLDAPEQKFTLAALQKQEIRVSGYIEEDAASDSPVTVYLAAVSNDEQTLTSWEGEIVLDPTASPLPLAAEQHGIALELAGGLNVAAIDMGGEPVEHDNSMPNELFDGVLSHRVFDGTVASVKLAGDGQVPLVGASFDLHGVSTLASGLKDYAIEVSDDGQNYREIVRGTLKARPGNQDVLFPSEIFAKYARLQLLSTQSADEREVPELGEWRVIARPGILLPEFPEMDLMREEWGGHEIWRDETAVVYGFHHDRAARIAAFEWRNRRVSNKHRPNLHQITVETSLASPAGPWESIGTFDVSKADNDGLKQRISLDGAPWARFLKLSTTDGVLREDQPLPGIYEFADNDDYRSLLGEWGGPVQKADYELSHPKNKDSSWNRILSSKNKPVELDAGQWTESVVWINEGWEDWFTIDAPSGKEQKSIEVEGDPFVRVAMEAIDINGNPVTLIPLSNAPGKRVWALPPEAKGRYRIHVYEPMRSVVFIWDMSGSMSAFLDGIASAVVNFAQEVDPKTERVQLLPLDEPPTPLLEDWESSPYRLSDTVRNFVPPDSSYAHLNLLKATNMLKEETGTRAAIMIADCETQRDINATLWQSLREVQPIVYTFHTTDVTRAFGVEQDDMQDWAAVGGGHYYLIQDPFQLDHAFGKLESQLRKPSGYRIRTSQRVLEKSTIELTDNRAPDSLEDPFDNGFMLILDMSASMRTPMPDGVTLRAHAAMDAVVRIIEQLPDGTSLGIRVFGHRGGTDCASTLLVPVGPLDKAKTIAALRTVRVSSLGNTSIGEALERSSEDMADITGQRHIIVLTDGEETCHGDPESAIANLVDDDGNTKVSFVGFMLADEEVQQKYRDWISVTDGAYYPATDAGSLETVMRNAMAAKPAPTFEILDLSGNVVVNGQVGAGPVELDSGYYRIRTEDGDKERFGTIKAIETKISIPYYPETPEE